MREGIAYIVVLMVGITIAGCGSNTVRSNTVRGQVFIVTKAHESVRLGLVTVAMYPQDALRQHVATKEAVATAARDSLDQQLKESQKAVNEARNALAAARAAANRAANSGTLGRRYQEALREKHTDTRWGPEFWEMVIDSIHQVTQPEVRRWQKELGTREITAVSARASQQLTAFYGFPAYFLEGLPPAMARVQTDANGEFELQVPEDGRFALVAHTERQVFDSFEEYAWFVLIPDEARKGAKLLLSNETLTTGASPLSLVHTSR